jgi:hypothetical protein
LNLEKVDDEMPGGFVRHSVAWHGWHGRAWGDHGDRQCGCGLVQPLTRVKPGIDSRMILYLN